MLPLQLQTVQICDPIVLSFPKMFQRHLEFKRSCCCVLFCSNLSPIISNNKTCLWFRVFIVGKSWIFEVLRKSPILWDFPNIKKGLCLANYFKSRFRKMAEIGVNCAFAVIGNTPYLSNVQHLDCTFFSDKENLFFFKIVQCYERWTPTFSVGSVLEIAVHVRGIIFIKIHRAPIKGLLPVVVCTSIQSLRWPLSRRTYRKMIGKRSRKKLRRTDWQEISLPNKT